MSVKKLFFLPHYDDEVFCLPKIVQARDSDEEFHIIYLTCDDKRPRVNTTRRDESVHMLTSFGISKDRIHHLGFDLKIPIRALSLHLTQALLELQTMNVKELEEIYTTAWEGGHPDHDAGFALAIGLAQKISSQVKVWQFYTYNAYQTKVGFRVATPIPGESLEELLSPEDQKVCLKAPFYYPSQWKTWLGLSLPWAWQVLINKQLAYAQGRAELLNSRPHSGPLLYEKRGMGNFEDLHAQVKTFVEKLEA